MNLFKYKEDISAGLVVFLVALPLCLGIALASGAPFFSGMIAGIVGGIVIGYLSNSHVSVSGPAAGLAAVVYTSLMTLNGSFEAFLFSVVIAGILQFVFGLFGMGKFSKLIPLSVIKGLLCAIGILIILKQMHHFLGVSSTKKLVISQLREDMSFGAVLIGFLSLGILLFWDKIKVKALTVIPAGLGVVILGLLLNEVFSKLFPSLFLNNEYLVQVPVAQSAQEFFSFFKFPDFSQWKNADIYIIGVTLAVIASIETLLCIEATDKLDVYKRTTDTNRELKAQGIGNIVSGFIGGLPITSVIVRSSANINAGAKSKNSTILHGLLLFLSVCLIPLVLNKIPLACLAAILLVTGYRLSNPQLFKEFFKKGFKEFVPFMVTIVGIVGLDLLKGVVIGLVIHVLLNQKKFSIPSFSKSVEVSKDSL